MAKNSDQVNISVKLLCKLKKFHTRLSTYVWTVLRRRLVKGHLSNIYVEIVLHLSSSFKLKDSQSFLYSSVEKTMPSLPVLKTRGSRFQVFSFSKQSYMKNKIHFADSQGFFLKNKTGRNSLKGSLRKTFR